MLYLVSELFENIAVRRWITKSQVTKRINRSILNGTCRSLLDVESAEHYSELLNIGLPAANQTEEIDSVLCLGDEVFCLLTPKEHAKSDIPNDAADLFVKDPDMFVYSGYYDQPLLDFLTYEYQDQVSIENTLVRNKKLSYDVIQESKGNDAIEIVTNSLKRLLNQGVIEADGRDEEYLSFVPNKNLRETRYRQDFHFRLTGQPQTGLHIPPCEVPVVNPNQLMFEL